MDMQSIVPNSSSTQNRDLLCFFPFSSIDTHWGSQEKKKKIGELKKNWNGCWSRHSVSGGFPPKQLGNLGSKFATKTGAGLSIKCK
jgi:hypothetical protein